jgi:hypothetical protein
MNRTLYFLILLFFISCNSKPKSTDSDVGEASSIESKTDSSSVTKVINEDIFDFLYKFGNDSAFQLSRIDFPLDLQHDLHDSVLLMKDWSHDRLFIDMEYIFHKTYDKNTRSRYHDDYGSEFVYSWINKYDKTSLDYYFRRDNGKWTLDKIESYTLPDFEVEDFRTFLCTFISDSSFQASRIKFPIDYKTWYEAGEDYNRDTIYVIDSLDWNFAHFYSRYEKYPDFRNTWDKSPTNAESIQHNNKYKSAS